MKLKWTKRGKGKDEYSDKDAEKDSINVQTAIQSKQTITKMLEY